MKDEFEKKTGKKVRVVMAGPLPPLIGGMATVIDDISKSSLPQRVELELFNTGKNTPGKRFLLAAAVSKLSLWRRWSVIIGARKETIAHIHTCSGLSFFLDGILLLIAKFRRGSVILHIHGAKFDKFLDSLPKPGTLLARWIAKKANKIVVLSEEWHDSLASRLANNNLKVINNGVPVPESTGVKKSGDTVSVLFLGNLSTRKGVWDLLQAMYDLPETTRLLLAGGEDEPGIGEKVNKEIAEQNLQNRVTWLGPVYGEEKQNLLSEADIFILPSYAEGLPISLLEAMCSGLPVIATPVGGIPTVVKNDQHGLLVEPGNVKDLRAAINTLATSAELRLRLGNEARRTCAANYGIEKVVNRYMALYTEIIQ